MVEYVRQQIGVLYRFPRRALVVYLIWIALAEIFTTNLNPNFGLIFHGAILIVLLLHSAYAWDRPEHGLLIALTLAPLIRLLSLSLPLNQFPLISWYLVVSIPLFVAGYVITRLVPLNWADIGFRITLKKVPLQLFIASTGLLFGFIEYVILRPTPLINDLSLSNFILAAASLILGIGLLEEFVFRGVMQEASKAIFGSLNIIFVTLVFMVLHIGYKSVLDLVFVFSVGYFWSWVKIKTNSLLGITLSHGITNILLLVIFPYLSSATYTSLQNTNLPLVSDLVNMYASLLSSIDKLTTVFVPVCFPLLVIYLYCSFITLMFFRRPNGRLAPIRGSEQASQSNAGRD